MTDYSELSRDEMIQECIGRGVPHDKRWGEAKLMEALELADARNEEGKTLAAEAEKRRKKAVETDPPMKCKVLPLGDGRISKGIHIPGRGDATFEKDEIATIPTSTFNALYERGFVDAV